jgi:hypothetical protein
MSEYYLVHTVFGSTPELILKILKDGYLYSSFYTGHSALFGRSEAKYVYFSLLNKNLIFGGITFFIDGQILFDRSFRYALGWRSEDSENIKVKYPKNNVHEILNKIMEYIDVISNDERAKLMSHEILLKKKVNLHNYLVAICCNNMLTADIIKYVKEYYPGVKILDEFPKTSQELNNMLNK